MSFVTESSRFQFCPLAFFASSEQNPNPKFPRAKPAKSAKNYGMDENTIATCVINRALDIHKEVGPGLLESVYEYYSQMLLSKADSRSNGRSQFLFIFAGSDSMRGFGQILSWEERSSSS